MIEYLKKIQEKFNSTQDIQYEIHMTIYADGTGYVGYSYSSLIFEFDNLAEFQIKAEEYLKGVNNG